MALYDSVANEKRDRDLRVDEFLALCKHLELDPIIFCPTDTERGDQMEQVKKEIEKMKDQIKTLKTSLLILSITFLVVSICWWIRYFQVQQSLSDIVQCLKDVNLFHRLILAIYRVSRPLQRQVLPCFLKFLKVF